MSSSKWFSRYLFVIVLMIAIFVVAQASKNGAIGIVWLASIVFLAVYWSIRDGVASEKSQAAASLPPQRVKPYQYFIAGFMGLVSAAATAAADINNLHSEGFLLSLVGLQDYVPIGAAALGALAAVGYAIGLRWFRIRPSSVEFYRMIGFSLLTMVLIYLSLFRSSNSESWLHFLSDFFKDGPIAIAKRQNFHQLSDISPIKALTPILQALGFVIGGGMVFMQSNPISLPSIFMRRGSFGS